MILIDAPHWHAHGTLWAHLISDSSLAELHDFAAHSGLPLRSFDLDHYDVPAARITELITAGAKPVPRRELIARLSKSGLRVRGFARSAAKRHHLAERWERLLPGQFEVGTELLNRWHEPHRVYHGPAHLTHTLDSLALLSELGKPIQQDVVVEALALWFHDAVHTAGVSASGADETRSAELAVKLLGPLSGRNQALSTGQVDEVARLVLLTQHHDPRGDDGAGARVSDADLAVLGSAPDRYVRYTRQIRSEFRQIPDEVFFPGRAEILEGLLQQGPIFRTPPGTQRWEQRAQTNIRTELATEA